MTQRINLRKDLHGFLYIMTAAALIVTVLGVVQCQNSVAQFHESLGEYGIGIAQIYGENTNYTSGIYYNGWDVVEHNACGIAQTFVFALGFWVELVAVWYVYSRIPKDCEITVMSKEA
jgi:hypothetical protein